MTAGAAPIAAQPVGRRRVGRPARIGFTDVLAVAARLPLETLTVQAVADELGVTRATIYRHVASTDELRRLAADATISAPDLPATGVDDWRQWLAAFARSLRRWRLVHADRVRFSSAASDGLGSASFGHLEAGLELLVAAGFDEESAARALQYVAGLVWINTIDEIQMGAAGGLHPQEAEVAGVADVPPRVRRMMTEVHVLSTPDERFERELRWALAGLAAQLDG